MWEEEEEQEEVVVTMVEVEIEVVVVEVVGGPDGGLSDGCGMKCEGVTLVKRDSSR